MKGWRWLVRAWPAASGARHEGLEMGQADEQVLHLDVRTGHICPHLCTKHPRVASSASVPIVVEARAAPAGQRDRVRQAREAGYGRQERQGTRRILAPEGRSPSMLTACA